VYTILGHANPEDFLRIAEGSFGKGALEGDKASSTV
jgi:hypothetical protein